MFAEHLVQFVFSSSVRLQWATDFIQLNFSYFSFSRVKNETNYILTLQLLQNELQCDILFSGNNLNSTTCIEDKETSSNSRTSKSRKCAVPLQNLKSWPTHPTATTDSQAIWRSKSEQPQLVWMWRENSRQEEMRRVRRKGGNKEKVFGCDLLEHLKASSQDGKWTVSNFFMTSVSHCVFVKPGSQNPSRKSSYSGKYGFPY